MKLKLKKPSFVRPSSSFGTAFKNFGASINRSAQAPKKLLSVSEKYGCKMREDYVKVQELKKNVNRTGVVKVVLKKSIYD